MSSEWFSEVRDSDAALAEYLVIIESSEDTPQAKKECRREFYIYFRARYKYGKETLTDANRLSAISGEISEIIFSCLNSAIKNIKEVSSFKAKTINKKTQAIHLGSALGLFLAVVDFGLTAGSFDCNPGEYQRILSMSRMTREWLDRINKRVKHTFIRNRIIRIAKKHANSLTENKKRLIVEIAVIFS